MHIENFEVIGTWRDVADAARTTIGLENGSGEPSDKWKKQMLLAEHSPIRKLIFKWKWVGLKSWISTHFVRHKIGIEHFVQSQRSDRTGVDRDKLTQDALVNHECIANAQAIINISRKRLCIKAANETRLAWCNVLDEIFDFSETFWGCCVPECVYRGFCPEFKGRGCFSTMDQEYIKLYRGVGDENTK